MFTARRTFIIGACSCICDLAFAASPVSAQDRKSVLPAIMDGCSIPASEVSRLSDRYPTLGHLGNAENSFGALIRSTGDRDVDVALDKAIKRLADTFDVYPGFGFFDDGNSPNAWATTANLIPNKTYTVIFGLNYYRKWLAYDPSGVSVLSVIAHEFGHIMQYKSGQYDEIKGGLTTSKRIELHADYMSGYYIGLLKRQNPKSSFWKAGDKFRQIGSYDDKNPQFHGTPEERVAASQQGFSTGYYDGRGAKIAFQLGKSYVATL